MNEAFRILLITGAIMVLAAVAVITGLAGLW